MMLTPQEQEKLIRLCQQMVQAKSYSGEESRVVKVMQDFCNEAGFSSTLVDRYGNCICCIEGKRPGPAVLLDGHIDTVPVPEPSAWSHDPFGGEVLDGKLYGRGTSDMKGALSAMLFAAARFAKGCECDFAGKVYVAGVVHEECFEGVAAREISARVQPDVVIIGEASALNLKVGQRGRAEIVVETFGKPAHSANPHKGINAVYRMAELVGKIREIEPPEQPVLGKGILELTDIKSAPYPGASVVPYYCRATYDRRLLVGETKEAVLAPIQAVIHGMAREDPAFEAKAAYAMGSESCYTGETITGERFFPGWLYDAQCETVQKVLAALREEGFTPEITHYDFCTNGSHYAGEAGIMTFGLGPSLETLAHTTDEYIELEQLFGAARCYEAALGALLR